jgi:hypothetical protein
MDSQSALLIDNPGSFDEIIFHAAVAIYIFRFEDLLLELETRFKMTLKVVPDMRIDTEFL